MKNRTKRAEQRAKLKALKASSQARPGGASNYARKRKYLAKYGGFGFEYVTKPWRAGSQVVA